jgi:hypothetical protein
MRSVIAIVAGYLVFGVSSAILFRVGGQDPHHGRRSSTRLSP